MKNINWIVRIKNKAFWVALIPAVLLLIQVVAAVFGIPLILVILVTNCLMWSMQYLRFL